MYDTDGYTSYQFLKRNNFERNQSTSNPYLSFYYQRVSITCIWQNLSNMPSFFDLQLFLHVYNEDHQLYLMVHQKETLFHQLNSN